MTINSINNPDGFVSRDVERRRTERRGPKRRRIKDTVLLSAPNEDGTFVTGKSWKKISKIQDNLKFGIKGVSAELLGLS